MALKAAYLVVAASLLMTLQCCNHVCFCDENEMEEEDDDLLLEVEDEEEATVSVFVPTHEWKTIEDGQAIPAGLHVRMNIETGKREAKLMDDPPSQTQRRPDDREIKPETTSQHDEGTKPAPVDNEHLTTGASEEKVVEGGEVKEEEVGGGDEEGGREREPESDSKFQGDQRRAHYYGHSDRIGIINKRRRMFTPNQAAEALREDSDETNTQTISGRISHTLQDPAETSVREGRMMTQEEETVERMGRSIHRELSEMLRHTKTLARKTATIPELLQALEELEYYVHHIDNAKELNSVGGLVVVVRLLNHSHPDIKSGAAHVIGAATQSNPQVQSEVLDYGGLQLLCRFIGSREPELVQRRGLFALSALLRGNTQPQLAFVQECRGLMQLGVDFDQRTMPTQLKIVTLLTDLLHEQDEVMHNSEELRSLLHSSVQQHGWCDHVPSLLHMDTLSPTEKALQAMMALQDLCDFTGHLPRLQELHRRFQESVKEQGEDEVSQSLLNHSQELLTNIRNRNREL